MSTTKIDGRRGEGREERTATMEGNPWTIIRGDSPIIATAIHDGHYINADSREHLSLSEEERLREEDPFTGMLTEVSDTRIIVHRSRFEVDLNRPREKAIYKRPEDAWGLKVWKDELPEERISYALGEYDQFNRDVFALLDEWKERFGRFVVYDLHSYNHRREGPDGPEADPMQNPEINVGTGNMDMERFGPLVERFVHDLSDVRFHDHPIDVRTNVKFQGGDFSRRIHDHYPDSACVLAIEFKKVFMDEWTGEPNRNDIRTFRKALASTIPGVLEELALLRS